MKLAHYLAEQKTKSEQHIGAKNYIKLLNRLQWIFGDLNDLSKSARIYSYRRIAMHTSNGVEQLLKATCPIFPSKAIRWRLFILYRLDAEVSKFKKETLIHVILPPRPQYLLFNILRWPFLCLCRPLPFKILEGGLDSNPESLTWEAGALPLNHPSLPT